MITYIYGDLFQSPAKVLVNAVNTVGVMGKGIALDFKKIYPEMFQRYQELCENGQFRVGQLWLYNKMPHKWILNFPTKKHWRDKSKVEYIELGLQKFVELYDSQGIDSISFPRLGCGNGELDWESEVRPLMERYLNPLPISVYIHLFDPEFEPIPERRDFEAIKIWLRTEPRNLSFSEVWDDLNVIIGKGLTLKTTDTKEDFRVAIDDSIGEPGLNISINEDQIFIPYESLVNLWQQLRSVGYLRGTYFSSGLDDYSNILIPVLSRLVYVEPALIDMKEPGLQFIAPAQTEPTQGKLWESM